MEINKNMQLLMHLMQFKSHYVVWKYKGTIDEPYGQEGLNRTM